MAIDDTNKTQNKSTFVVKIIRPNSSPINISGSDVLDFFFIEDIYAYSIIGKVTFVDKAGAMEFLPITGEEDIAIIYGIGETNQELRFRIFSFGNVSQTGQVAGSATNVMEIYFVDPYFTNLTQKRFSRSWVNSGISDIVEDITLNMVGRPETIVNLERSQEELSYFYMPYWTPMEAIMWLSKRASGEDSGTAGYLYYQTSLGMNYVTLDKLFQNKMVETDSTGNVLSYKPGAPGDLEYVNTIFGWEISPIDMSALSGIKGGHRLGYNFLNKALIDNKYIYSSSVSKYTMLGKRTLYPDISDETAKYSLEGDASSQLLDNIYYDEFVKRYSKQFAIIVTVRGNEKRYAGMIVDLQWPSSQKSEIIHKALEGKYLVKSITHSFTGRSHPPYQQKMVLLKNAYTDSDSKTLLAATKMSLTIKTKKMGKEVPA